MSDKDKAAPVGDVKRYIADVATCVDVIPVESVSGAKFVLASDYAALEAELARLRAGGEPVALQVVAHTQGNLMKSIGHFTDCRTDEGVTVGLIDTIINSARLLATRNLNHPAIVEAIKDLCSDSDVLKLVSPQPSAGVVMPERKDESKYRGTALFAARLWNACLDEFASLNGKEVGRG